MCRKSKLHGFCILCFGLGLMVGHSLESWMLCTCGGIGLVCFGFFVSRRR